jgi:alkanesulfonate monooxygenase SsuD/methylene tetrahydromethanopterin reductase-like flavin-dependent oxidoreductase (luciferase family)
MPANLELGLDTFGDVTVGPDGALLPHAQVIRDLVEQAVLADELGIDFFGIGEHHRADFAVSSPETVLAGIATRTSRIRLGSAVTVLSSDDPIRVFQRFSTVDALSNGRAEVILGRGSFTESFPLFGFDLSQYEVLFEEKLDLFVELIRKKSVTWEGSLRPPLKNQHVFPPIEKGELTTWIGVGGSPESVVRAARYDLPLMLAIIGGPAQRFAPYVQLYRDAMGRLGHGRAAPSACIRPAMSQRRMRRQPKSSSPPSRRCATASAPSAAGVRCRARSSSARFRAARSISARLKPSRARSPRR